MTALQWVNTIIVALGIPSIITGLVVLGRKLEVLDSLKKDVHDFIKPDLKDVRERFASLEGKAAGLFQNNSPVSLTPKGTKALEKSGLKDYIDTNKDLLIGGCSSKGSMDTPYDVQESVMNFFREYNFPKEVEDKLKMYAFQDGTTIDSMRLIGGIYFRDVCLKVHGFKAVDLDKPKGGTKA